jgi:hypothetical protein
MKLAATFIFASCLRMTCAFAPIFATIHRRHHRSVSFETRALPIDVNGDLIGISSTDNHQSQSPIMSRRTTFRSLLTTVAVTAITVSFSFVSSAAASDSPRSFDGFKRITPIQFIAALGDPKSSTGTNAFSEWGVWTVDPGPRGVRLQNAKDLEATKRGPYGWPFDNNDWWLEEHGLIMETPDFALPSPGRYVVTGGRETTCILTVADDGSWSLAGGATLADVTHLPCRAARYTSKENETSCRPTKANPGNFPVKPGALMPPVSGCAKQDYAVIFVIGKEIDSSGMEL